MQVKQCEIGWHRFKLDQYNITQAKDIETILSINAYDLFKLIERALTMGYADSTVYRLFAKPIISSMGDYGINFAIDLRLVLREDL